ncbi:MAG TPA: lyase family protein [Candidatus Polarisedimenticolaceae bacterium]|nr:lyase family protein [Candidatus Polarisedimenticolaceae bacterium]
MKSTLWSQHVRPHPRMLALTVGNDREVDAGLLAWDILGSLGHVEGLYASGLITVADRASLRAALRAAFRAAASGRFTIGKEDEDVHSAVEGWVTKRAGRAGAKLHTARSRNDQIACDLRLYLKRALLDVHAEARQLVETLLAFATRHASVAFPGYTHGRKAMPSSLGLWAAGHAAGLIDTLESFPSLWAAVDRSPLGSAAGYGVPLPLDRAATAAALGFQAVESPVTAVQNGRGKLEAAALFWCVQLAHDTAKAASDAIHYTAGEYGYLELDRRLATGSSLMPHKRNPDLFELCRGRAAATEGDLAATLALRAKLVSGYHRDFQLLKEPLMRALPRTSEMLEMLRLGVSGLTVDRARCAAALDGGVRSTGAALELAAAGVPFREAYRTVSKSVEEGRRDAGRTTKVPRADLRPLRARAVAVARFAVARERALARTVRTLAGAP